MQYTLIDEQDAPTRPTGRRGGRRHRELDVLVAALTPGQVARIDLSDADKPGPIRKQLFEAAARAGRSVEVWEGSGAGVFYAALVQSQLGGPPDD